METQWEKDYQEMETQWERRQWDHRETEIPVDHQLDDWEVEWMKWADVRKQDFVQLVVLWHLLYCKQVVFFQ